MSNRGSAKDADLAAVGDLLFDFGEGFLGEHNPAAEPVRLRITGPVLVDLLPNFWPELLVC